MKECAQYIDELELFHDGELPADRRETVAAHLEKCPDCKRELALLSQLSVSLKSALGEVPDFHGLPGLETRIKAHIANPSPSGSGWLLGWKPKFGLRMSFVGGLALVAVLCFMFMTSTGHKDYRFTKGTPETIESDGTIFVAKIPDSDVEVTYVFDVGV